MSVFRGVGRSCTSLVLVIEFAWLLFVCVLLRGLAVFICVAPINEFSWHLQSLEPTWILGLYVHLN